MICLPKAGPIHYDSLQLHPFSCKCSYLVLHDGNNPIMYKHHILFVQLVGHMGWFYAWLLRTYSASAFLLGPQLLIKYVFSLSCDSQNYITDPHLSYGLITHSILRIKAHSSLLLPQTLSIARHKTPSISARGSPLCDGSAHNPRNHPGRLQFPNLLL